MICSTGATAADHKPGAQVKVLNVCEVLADITGLAGRAVTVVGRMERSVSLIDHSEFFSQDRCEQPVFTHGHVWSDKIQILSWEKGIPRPPRDRPKFEQSVVASKLAIVRQSTELGFHGEPQFKAEGRSIVYTHTADVPNQWAIAYGRIVRMPDLKLAIIVEPYNFHELSEDGAMLPEKDGRATQDE